MADDSSEHDRIRGDDERKYLLPVPAGFEEAQIDYAEILGIFTRRKLLFVLSIVACLGLSVAAAFLQTKFYESTVLVAPASDGADTSSLGSLAGQFGGLASLAGLELDSADSRAQALAILNSRSLAEHFIRTEDLLPVLFDEHWNDKEGRWDVPEQDVPSMWDAVDEFGSEVRKVNVDGENGLINVSMTWHDPAVAARWANTYVGMANQRIREDAVEEASQSIEYLNEQLAKTSSIELQQAIYRLIETKLNTIMLANVREEFAFKVLDVAVAPDPDDFVSPRRKLIVVIGFLAGVFLAVLLSLVAHARSRLRDAEKAARKA